MKSIRLIIILVIIFLSISILCSDRYELELNGKKFQIDLNKETIIKTPGGEKIKILLKKNKYSVFSDSYIHFKYPSKFSVTKHKINDDILQIQINAGTGNLLLIQEYNGTDPTPFLDTFFNQVIKQFKNIDINRKNTFIKKTMKNGIILYGLNTQINTGLSRFKFEVYSYFKNKKGIIIFTGKGLNSELSKNKSEFFIKFWESIRFIK